MAVFYFTFVNLHERPDQAIIDIASVTGKELLKILVKLINFHLVADSKAFRTEQILVLRLRLVVPNFESSQIGT